MRAIVCTVRIGDGGVIEQVEKLDPELGAVPFLEREGLEDREIPVLEARVAEDVPAHSPKGMCSGRNHDRVADYVAAARLKRTGVGVHRRTRTRSGDRRGEFGNDAAANLGLFRATNIGGSCPGNRVDPEARAVGYGTRAGLEVGGVSEEIPAILGLPR